MTSYGRRARCWATAIIAVRSKGSTCADRAPTPAGVAHRNEGASRDLLVIGAYAGGRDYDTCTAGDADALARIRAAPKPAADPVYGARGPLLKAWGVTSP